ncbi:MAG TPA: diaminopropionate ammonia-lyase [Desulfobacteraceae bacterium]|nr:diaminopropionate ammonia-lyase [Deltaproteobacteria bacterium]HDI60381.1 diaminopropionate ammonia-lyase [Desulfobacteraceae bacterium]
MDDATGIQFAAGHRAGPPKADDGRAVEDALAFYRSLPDYTPTPLVCLDRLAAHLGLGRIWVKNEGRRFGLKAFKAMGAAYGLCRALARKLGVAASPLTLAALTDPSLAQHLAQITCITATDGNHGRAVAWAAQRLGCRAVVYMPRGTTPARIDNVRMFGAAVEVIDGTYDQAVALAAAAAEKHGWLFIQDTFQDGDEAVPAWIMNGYRVLVRECLDALGDDIPTHVVLQAGVGSFAAAIQAELSACLGERRPRATVVEPTRAACFYRSALAGDGQPHPVEGDLDTIMAGLACGVPSPLAWNILWPSADLFVACPDRVARRGMRVLGNPLEGDPPVISGESGAVGLGLVFETMSDPRLAGLKQAMGLDPGSRVLVFSTEADTDPVMYRRVVWGDR